MTNQQVFLMQMVLRSLGQSIKQQLQRRGSTLQRILIVVTIYATYLPFSGYTELVWDSEQYWQLVSRFFAHTKHFSLWNYNAVLRGYLGPLLIMPVRVVCLMMNWLPINGSRAIGVVWAAMLFGVVWPAVWTKATGESLRNRAWLIMVGLAFVFWRDYFNFCIQDVPALTLVLLALLALARSSLAWVFIGGVLLAGAMNMRPIYLASIPGALGWLWWQTNHVGSATGLRKGFRRFIIVIITLLTGAAVVLLPQSIINYRQFHKITPLVLAADEGHISLYLTQLNWGMAYQRYESSIIPEHYGGITFADSLGMAQLRAQPSGFFSSYTQFALFALQHPISMTSRYLRHIFNGLDLWFPSPYPRHMHPSGQAVLKVLNYIVLILGFWHLFRCSIRRVLDRDFRPSTGISWLLLAVLLPVLLAVPTLIECRFLFPLHLILLTVVAANLRPLQWLNFHAYRQFLIILLLGAGVWGAWTISEATSQQILPVGYKAPGY